MNDLVKKMMTPIVRPPVQEYSPYDLGLETDYLEDG